jgi:transcriptional regulator with XRE-family HTH domain
MSATLTHHTDLDRPLGFDRLPSPRGTALITLLGVGAALFGGSLTDDRGTRIVERVDYRPVIDGTTLHTVRVEGPVMPFQTPTRMAQIRTLAPLSLRDWASVFGVSHSAIKQWADGEEPNRDKLDRVLGALNEASAHQANLAAWLTTQLPGMELRPVELLRAERWRAFRGAIRTRSAPAVSIEPEELVRRRRAQVSWAVPEPPITSDDQE